MSKSKKRKACDSQSSNDEIKMTKKTLVYADCPYDDGVHPADRLLVDAIRLYKTNKIFNGTTIIMTESDRFIIDTLISYKPIDGRKYLPYKWNIPSHPHIDVTIDDFISRMGPKFITSFYPDFELVWYEKRTLRAIFSTKLHWPRFSRRWFVFPFSKLRSFKNEDDALHHLLRETNTTERRRILGDELWDKLTDKKVFISRYAQWSSTDRPYNKKGLDPTIRTMLLVAKQPHLPPLEDITDELERQREHKENEDKEEKEPSLTSIYDIKLSKETYRRFNFRGEREDNLENKNLFMMSAFQTTQWEEDEIKKRQRRVDKRAKKRAKRRARLCRRRLQRRDTYYYSEGKKTTDDDDTTSTSSSDGDSKFFDSDYYEPSEFIEIEFLS